MSDCGKIFPLWREAAAPHWQAYTQHEFVQGLGNGRLPRAAFMAYLKQDYLFLIHFARAWALGVTKAESIAEMRHCAETVDALINHEMALHMGICAEAGISEKQLLQTEEAFENIAYTRYVLDAGHSGDFLDLLAALAPCVLGYGEIGKALAAQAGKSPYRQWIETYAEAEYQELCGSVGALLDKAVTQRLGPDPQASPRWQKLCHRFTTATRLEVSFWDMGLRLGAV